MMDPNSLSQIVNYVRQNPGCTRTAVKAVLPHIKDADAIIDAASLGVPVEDGYILREDAGKLYMGPSDYLIK